MTASTPPLNLMMPGNPRYQPEMLKAYFGYDHLYKGINEVELANLRTLAEIGIIPTEVIALLTTDIEKRVLDITTTEVDALERITRHDIRADTLAAQKILPPELGVWFHVLLTSYDPIETGRTLQYIRAYKLGIRPALVEVIQILARRVREFADWVQIGRTHGQHALPITAGFWLATILSRLVYNLKKMDEFVDELVGKISGAVGAYNAQVGLGISELCGDFSYERRVLAKLGLLPARISTQILPPEPLAYFLHSVMLTSGAIAQFANDARQLARSEIAEVVIVLNRAEGESASSTMVGKANPIDYENIVGMWLSTKWDYGKVLEGIISEHQRDLVASSLMRSWPTILVNLAQQLTTLLRKDSSGRPFLERFSLSKEACERNVAASAHIVLAEPLYIGLQMAGYPDTAYDFVNKRVVPTALAERRNLIDIVEELAQTDKVLAAALAKMPAEVRRMLKNPSQYTGLAREKAFEIAEYALDSVKDN